MAIRRLFAIGVAIGLMSLIAIPVAASGDHHGNRDHNTYTVKVLAQGPAPDPDLVNGWGISRLPTSPGGSRTTARTRPLSTGPMVPRCR